MTDFIAEFKKFAIRGNVIDLTVGVIIGTAFGKIISSIVGDLVMPTIGIVIGNIDLKSLQVGPVAVGNFLQATVDFIIIALAVFLLAKGINFFRTKEVKELKESELTREEKLLVEIRDTLRAGK